MPGKFPLLSPPAVKPETGPFGASGTKGLNPFGRGTRMRRVSAVFDKGGEYDPGVFDKRGTGTMTIGPGGRSVSPGDWDQLQKQLEEDRKDDLEEQMYKAPSKRKSPPVTKFKRGGRTKARRRIPGFDFGGLFNANPATTTNTGITSNYSTGVTNNNIASAPYMNLENQVLGNAAGLQGATASQYIAPFNATQQQAFGDISADQGNYQPFYNQASGAFNTAQGTAANLAPSAMPYVQQAGNMQTGTQAFNPFAQQADVGANTTVGNYMSPYMQNAMGAVGDASNRAFTQLGGPLSQINDTFSGGSAAQFGREGHGNAVGNAVYSQQQALDQQLATMANTGYQSAMTADQADLTRQAQLGQTAGTLANAGIGTEAALGQTAANIGQQGTQANVAAGTAQQGLGTATQAAGYTDANALLSAGNQQQQLQQQMMSFPLQLNQYMQSLGQGWQLPTSSNFTNSGNTNQFAQSNATPGSGSTAGQIVGGATALAGAANNIFGSNNSNPTPTGPQGTGTGGAYTPTDLGGAGYTPNAPGNNPSNAARGGQIKHFDVGGYNPTVVGIRKRNALRKPPPSPMGPMGGMGGMPPTGMPGMPPQAPPNPVQPMPAGPMRPPPGPMGPMGGRPMGPPPPIRRAQGGSVPGYASGGGLSDILGTLGSLAGNLIPIPIIGPMIGKFAGNALGDVIGGHTDAIGSDAERDFTLGIANPDAPGGVNPGAIPGLGGLSKLIGGGGGSAAANTAGSAATDAGSWGGGAGSAATDAGSWGGDGLSSIGSALDFARGGRIPRFATGSSTSTTSVNRNYDDLDDPFSFMTGRSIAPSTAEFRIVPGSAPQLPNVSVSGGGGGSAGSTAGGIGSLMSGVGSLATSLFGKSGLFPGTFAEGGKFDYGETAGRRMSPFALDYVSQYFAKGGRPDPITPQQRQAMINRAATPDNRSIDQMLRDQNAWLSPPGPAYPGQQQAFDDGGTVDDATVRGGYSPFLDSSTGLQGRLDPGSFTMSPADRYALRQRQAAANAARAQGYQTQANADPAGYWGDFAKQTGRGLSSMAQLAGIPGSIDQMAGMPSSVFPTMSDIGDHLDRLFGKAKTAGGDAGRIFGEVLPAAFGVGEANAMRNASRLHRLWDAASNVQNIGAPVLQSVGSTR